LTERGPLPPKLYFRIGEVANLVGVEPHVLRYWEREFRTIRPTKSAKGQRVYSRRDVESLLRVRELLYGQGFTIAGARRRMRDKESDDTAAGGGDKAATEAVREPEPMAAQVLARDDLDAVPSSAPNASSPGRASTHLPETVRAELEALKTEVESLLAELGGAP
jgi:DNA-binding transcriptional MerR regulator